MSSEIEFICIECPLASCDSESLWCALSWIKEPNKAQQRFTEMQRAMFPKPRQEYYANYYADNRERKIAKARERYHAKRSGNNAQLQPAGVTLADVITE